MSHRAERHRVCLGHRLVHRLEAGLVSRPPNPIQRRLWRMSILTWTVQTLPSTVTQGFVDVHRFSKLEWGW